MTTTPKSTDNLFSDVLKAKQAQNADGSEGLPERDPAGESQEGETETEDETQAEQAPDELDYLKKRAKLMGIAFSNNIGVEALKAKINAKLASEETENKDDETNEDGDEQTTAPVQQSTSAGVSAETQATANTPRSRIKNLRQQMKEEQMRLVRLRITNLNPAKKDLPGEILTFSNKILGTVRKFVPYGEATENGYHVPYCLYLQLKEREFQNIKVRKDSRGRQIVETGMAREFALEELPALTERELAQLAASQAAAKGMD